MYIAIERINQIIVNCSNVPDTNPDVDWMELDVELTSEFLGKRWNGKTGAVEDIEKTDEQKAEEIRATRDRLLKDSDWVFFADSPVSDEKKELWKVYRKELRDITSQENFPNNVVFPEKPS